MTKNNTFKLIHLACEVSSQQENIIYGIARKKNALLLAIHEKALYIYPVDTNISPIIRVYLASINTNVFSTEEYITYINLLKLMKKRING